MSTSRLTERQQLKKLKEEADREERLREESKTQPPSELEVATTEDSDSASAVIGKWTEAVTEHSSTIRVCIRQPKDSVADTDDEFNVEDSDEEEEAMTSRHRLKRKRQNVVEEEKDEDNDVEAASVAKKESIPRLKKKVATEERMKYISKDMQQSALLAASGVPRAQARGNISGGLSAVGSSRPKRPLQAPHPVPGRSIDPHPNRGLDERIPTGAVHDAAGKDDASRNVAARQSRELSSKRRVSQEMNAKLLQNLGDLVSITFGPRQSDDLEPNTMIDMSGSFLRDEANRFEFFDTDEGGICFQAKIPVFPEDFTDSQDEWPLSWWGIVDPALQDIRRLRAHREVPPPGPLSNTGGPAHRHPRDYRSGRT